MNFQILALLFLWGAILAAAHNAALWWTVRRLATAPNPVLWTVGSYYLRLAGLGLGIYVGTAGSFARLTATFAGFLLARLFILRWMRRPAAAESKLAGESQ